MAGTKSALTARAAAVKALQTAHSEEYDGLLRDARVAEGLPPQPLRGLSVTALRVSIEKAEARAAKARAQLVELGVE
jgi:hypothetical protein